MRFFDRYFQASPIAPPTIYVRYDVKKEENSWNEISCSGVSSGNKQCHWRSWLGVETYLQLGSVPEERCVTEAIICASDSARTAHWELRKRSFFGRES